ncbi:protein ROH1-like isoform X2 [Impatiens glandulifera]|nr:protein ROH1-like isoform X2 [Impatiens glandulifera]XP_047321736.1 protein ROH1-like isoform X2 [Impatiens glandulifera]
MPSSENESPSVHFASIRRAIQNIRSDQVHATDTNNNEPQVRNSELELFQKQAHDRFHNLSNANANEFLSAAWTQKLLDAFLACQEDFRVILSDNRTRLSKPPLDRILSDFFEKSIKALDICNATRDGIEKIRMWQKHLEIVICALDCKEKMISEGQLRRARKSLMEVAILMLDDKERGSSLFSNRNKSFGQYSTGKDNNSNNRRQSSGHTRSLSWSVSHSWSAAKQLQAMASSLVPPRANEVAATNGLAVPVYAASSILMFVMWTLVAAIPCQDRGLQAHFSIPRQFAWATPLLLLHDQVMEESKKRENKNSSGLLKEVVELVKCIQYMIDLLEQVQFPITNLQSEEVEMGVNELDRAFRACKDCVDPLERRLREVFRKIMSCRTEGLELLNRTNATTS